MYWALSDAFAFGSCRFNLGYNPPKVHGVRVYPVAAPGGEKLTLELEMEWHSFADIALSACFSAQQYLSKPVGSVVNLFSNLLPLTVSCCFSIKDHTVVALLCSIASSSA